MQKAINKRCPEILGDKQSRIRGGNTNPDNNSNRSDGFQVVFLDEIGKWDEEISRDVVSAGEVPVSRELDVVPWCDDVAVSLERGEGLVLWGWGWDVGGDLACGWVDKGGVGCEEDGWLDGDV